MAILNLTTDQKQIDLAQEETILDGALRDGINHAHACGGHALCSTCRVYIDEGLENVEDRTEAEQTLASRLGLTPEIRLACQTKISGDVSARRLVVDDIDRNIVLEHGNNKGPRSLGEEKNASVLFVDIADYTKFAERTPAYDVVHVLNRYFYIAGSIIKEHHGRIIDYYGDGFLAIFGLDGNKEHAKNIIKAGFALQEAVDKFDHDIHELTNADFKIRLGGHTGKIIWGTIGIEGMQKEAAVGDVVNFASRIESANKELNTRFLVSEDLYKASLGTCIINQEHEIHIKGKEGSHKVYSLDCAKPRSAP